MAAPSLLIGLQILGKHVSVSFYFLFISFFSFFLFYFSSTYPDGSTLIKHEINVPGGRWTSEEADLQTCPEGDRLGASSQVEWFCSSCKDRIASAHPVEPRSWSSFPEKTSQTLQTQLQLIYLSLLCVASVTPDMGAPHGQMLYLYFSISSLECFLVHIRRLKSVCRVGGHPQVVLKLLCLA